MIVHHTISRFSSRKSVHESRCTNDALTKICETATAAKGKPSLYIKLRERGQQTSH